MGKLSVIIPYVLEWPLPAFTVRSIIEDLNGRIDYEIILIDNYCDAVMKQQVNRVYNDFDISCGNFTKKEVPVVKHLLKSGKPESEIKAILFEMVKNDRTNEQFKYMQKYMPCLKVLQYDKTLSHWQAKNLAIKESTGDILCFIDAHCMLGRDALYDMFYYYEGNHKTLNGSIHLPLSYHIIEQKKLAYKLVSRPEESVVEYSFTTYAPKGQDVYEVPCMSTCGMMITKKMLIDDIGGWPTELGIYGGGENFLNFTMSVLGFKKWVKAGNALHHHGDTRKYSWDFNNHLRNKTIANYIFGGREFVINFMDHSKGGTEQKLLILDDVLTNKSINEHHDFIQANKVISIEEWAKKYDMG